MKTRYLCEPSVITESYVGMYLIKVFSYANVTISNRPPDRRRPAGLRNGGDHRPVGRGLLLRAAPFAHRAPPRRAPAPVRGQATGRWGIGRCPDCGSDRLGAFPTLC